MQEALWATLSGSTPQSMQNSDLPEVPEVSDKDRRTSPPVIPVGFKLKLPGGAEIEVRGLTAVIMVFFGLIAINSWVLWELNDNTKRFNMALERLTCLFILPPDQRETRWRECIGYLRINPSATMEYYSIVNAHAAEGSTRAGQPVR